MSNYLRQQNRIEKVYQSTKRISSCEGKVAFETRGYADNVIKRDHNNKGRMVYRCSFCNKWHVGSKIKG